MSNAFVIDEEGRPCDTDYMELRESVLLTDDDYRLFPEAGPRFQLIEGGLYMSPSPSRYHQAIARNITYLLMKHLERNPIGEVFQAPLDVYLGRHDVFQPDILFVSCGRKGILAEDGVHGAPDAVVEILSPATARLDRESKLKVYARSGVREMWIVDPNSKTISVFEFDRDVANPIAVHGATSSFASISFPGLMIDAEAVFRS